MTPEQHNKYLGIAHLVYAGLYCFWFLFSEPGKLLYDKPAPALPRAPPSWLNAAMPDHSEHKYVPPTAPPNWR